MNALIGIILVIVVLFSVYYMYNSGMFQPVTDILSGLPTALNAGIYGQEPQHSDYYSQVRIRFVALGPSVQNEQMALVAHPKAGGVDVTGWTIKTGKGSFKIPQTYNLYSPSTPDAAPEDIFLRDGDRIVFFGGVSPDKRNVRVAQGDYRIWLGDFLKGPHDTITLKDSKGILVDTYVY